MKRNLLLPHACKWIGSGLLVIAVLLCLAEFFQFAGHKHLEAGLYLPAIVATMIALPVIALSRERIEDEYISEICRQTLIVIIYLFFLLNLLLVFISPVGGRCLDLGTFTVFRFWTGWLSNPIVICAVYLIAFNLRLWLSRRRMIGNDETTA